MRVITLLVLFFLSATISAQSRVDKFLDSTVYQLKKQAKIDKNNFEVFDLLETVYNETLQSDEGELSQKTAQKINAYRADSKIKNKHLLTLFLMYQDYISQTAAQGRRANAEYQLACITQTEKEIQNVYEKVPAIVYIYKAEALGSAGRVNEASALIAAGLKKFPNSIPLKVYKYVHLKDQSIKKDLVENHSKHWMVQQFGIK